jgi:hypothetical protein
LRIESEPRTTFLGRDAAACEAEARAGVERLRGDFAPEDLLRT